MAYTSTDPPSGRVLLCGSQLVKLPTAEPWCYKSSIVSLPMNFIKVILFFFPRKAQLQSIKQLMPSK